MESFDSSRPRRAFYQKKSENMVQTLGVKEQYHNKYDIHSPLLLALHSLATRIPKVILPRIEEEFPELWTDTVILSNKQITSGSQTFYTKIVQAENSCGEGREKSACDFSTDNIESEIQRKHSCMCYICNRGFENGDALKSHFISHNSNLMQCKVCDDLCKDVSKLNEHYKMHRENSKHGCDVCGKKFVTDSKLRLHMIVHSDIFPLECKTCKKRFKHHWALNEHYVTHSDNRNYVCDLCKESYKTRNCLKIHIISIHSGERLYKCNVCNKPFKMRGYLKSHMLLHKGEKPYTCVHCNKCFRQTTHLRQHISTVHLHQRKYDCKECGKKFTQSTHLKTHMLTHTREKRYVCNECNAAFPYRASLEFHWRRHFEIRSYQCPHCPLRFFEKCSQRGHIQRVHIKRPKCDICGKTFRTIKQCRKHVINHSFNENVEAT